MVSADLLFLLEHRFGGQFGWMLGFKMDPKGTQNGPKKHSKKGWIFQLIGSPFWDHFGLMLGPKMDSKLVQNEFKIGSLFGWIFGSIFSSNWKVLERHKSFKYIGFCMVSVDLLFLLEHRFGGQFGWMLGFKMNLSCSPNRTQNRCKC